MALRGKISLVLADVDGTLVTEQKVLTRRTRNAVKALQDAGISFAVTSGRPPRGMAMLFDPLDLNTPIAGFNGGLSSNGISRSLRRRRCRGAVGCRAPGDRSYSRAWSRRLGLSWQ